MPKRRLGYLYISALISVLIVAGIFVHLYFRHERLQSGDSAQTGTASQLSGYLGSSSCRECHERFYALWSTSHHGLAMQPYTPEFARTHLIPQEAPMAIGGQRYQAVVDGDGGWVLEDSPKGRRKHRIAQVLGGKNVYYFLTPWERGRLQVLPVAYDVRQKEWFDTAASGVRSHLDMADAPLHWTDRPYTFNTSCYSCHVSQLSINYDLDTDSYRTAWVEPGINCETCHGPGADHVDLFRKAKGTDPPKDPKIIRVGSFTVEQKSAACAPCHAKMRPLGAGYMPGARYFDHFDLAMLEDRDFYPDGRDLGENYTYTLWLTSPCVQAGQLNCLHCHTSSGRYRFQREQANGACLPCHEKRVQDIAAHTHHKPDGPAGACIACHMPKTTFARMVRSDHSMRPPTPAATARFRSPNACNLCHKERNAAWADQWVRRWHKRDYQAAVLERAALVEAARKREWKRLPDILRYIEDLKHDEVYAASLIRLLRGCEDSSIQPVLLKALNDRSPLVRASAADALSERLTPENITQLVAATQDEYRLVRIRAAAALSHAPLLGQFPQSGLDRATAEFLASLKARPDDVASQVSLGDFYGSRREPERAIGHYEIALRLAPDSIPALVNASLAYNTVGRNEKAEDSLRRALAVEPSSYPANLNLGLLLAEMGRRQEAETALRAAAKSDPQSAVAAYNLGVLLSDSRPEEALIWCRKAAALRPQEPKYAYTLAFYERRRGNLKGAVQLLHDLIRRHSAYEDGYRLLADIYESQGDRENAVRLCRQAAANESLPEEIRQEFLAKLRSLANPRK